MSSYREQGLQAKAARLGITDQRTGGTKSKRARPFVLECRLANPKTERGKQWRKWGEYRTEDEARRTMELQARKAAFYEWRLKPSEQDEHQPAD